ncbi:hypothetical protein ACHAWF_002078 [Thalassiosira exigua]
MPPNALLATVLRRAPFTVFSKAAPSTLPKYDYDVDFCYFFFNDAMKHFSGISPSFLTSGKRNAKTDFPVDYEAYFEDDAAVCQEYPHPKVKVITEPWRTPAMRTIVETRKTAMTARDGSRYMLGCFGPHDDVELGVTEFEAGALPPELSDEERGADRVPTDWYRDAFVQLPLATILLEGGGESGSVLSRNILAEETGLDVGPLKAELEEVASLPEYDSYHFAKVNVGGESCRVWCWRPDGKNRDLIAVSARPRHAKLPSQIEARLT